MALTLQKFTTTFYLRRVPGHRGCLRPLTTKDTKSHEGLNHRRLPSCSFASLAVNQTTTRE
jgi:hypothetical protein